VSAIDRRIASSICAASSNRQWARMPHMVGTRLLIYFVLGPVHQDEGLPSLVLFR
jgi:hypothetical protein